MTFLSRLFPKRPFETIRLVDGGFVLDRDGIEYFRVLWGDVREIVTFKRDLVTTDCVCVAFRSAQSTLYYEVNEEIPGFVPLADELPRRFTDIAPQWFNRVTQPAFATNWTRLYGEGPPESSGGDEGRGPAG
jgi:hypothetical protein